MKKVLLLCLMLIIGQYSLAQKIRFYTPRTVQVVKENGTVFNKKSLVVTAEPEKVKVNDSNCIVQHFKMDLQLN